MASNGTLKDYLPLLHEKSKEYDLLTSLPYVGIGLLVTLLLYRLLTPKEKGAIRQLGGLSILSAWAFFTKRYDFLWANFGNDLHFKFNVLQHSVVAVRGEEARKKYFENKAFSFTEGYKIFVGGAPRLQDIDVNECIGDDVTKFNKRLITVLNKDTLSEIIPTLFSDFDKRMQTWGKQGRMDPFDSIYSLVFQLTVRMATCAEISGDFKVVKEIQRLYLSLEKSCTPAALLLPWFPGPAKRRKDRVTKELYMTLYGYVEQRRSAAVPSSDAFDVLLAQGLPTTEVVDFALAVIFAGINNTGINASWTLLYLAFHGDWLAKAKAEVNTLIQKYTTASTSESLTKRLSAIPLSAWETEMPILELVIRETIRITATGAALRRNVLEDISFSGGIVKPGEFVTYSLGDAHMNPEIYPQPDLFDPDRYTAGREEDKKSALAYLGWGGGRHVCSGMKIAKLEIKMIVTCMLAGFEFSIVDRSGQRPKQLPRPNRNDLLQAKPVGEACYLQFRRTVE